ncbi:hypothetical protein PG985_010826 [Apiospora marii]|uniref:uncharacterized protein n=1 Tax=Apiospora marii TaxID=335849 RepID=UPI0031326B76
MSLVSRTPFQLTGRYADRNRWENLAGPGDSRPTGLQVVEDEGLLDGAWGANKVCLVTGVSSGAGTETVRALAATGATVYGTARDLEKARAALGPELLATGRVHVLLIDQADLASVRRCAADFRERSDRLNVLVNNAAVMNTPQSFTKDGFELQFGTNHLSHFLLFHELRDLLLASSTPAFHSRVVNVTSAGRGGLYLEGCAVAGPAPADSLAAGDALEYGYGGWAFDEGLEGRLWEKSLAWVGAASS